MPFKVLFLVICVAVLIVEIKSAEFIKTRVNILEQKVTVLTSEFALWQLDFQDVKTNLSDLHPCCHAGEKSFKSDKDDVARNTDVTSERDNRNEAVLLAFKTEKKHRKQFEKTILDKLVEQEKQQMALQDELAKVKSKLATIETKIASGVSDKRVDDLEATVSAVQEQLSECRSSLTEIDDKVIEVDKKQTEQMANSSRELWKNVNDKITNDLKGLSEQTEQMNGVLDGIVTQLAHHRISFSARLNTHIPNLKAYETVVFKYAINNEGSAYNTTTGVFTAPIHGVYVFFTHIMGADRVMEMYIKKNNYGVSWLYSSGVGYGRDANMVVLELVPGDRVYVAKHGVWGQAPFYVHSSWTSFSGFLLFPM